MFLQSLDYVISAEKKESLFNHLFPSFFPEMCICYCPLAFVLLCESGWRAGSRLDCALSFQLFHCPTHTLNTNALCSFIVIFSHTHTPLLSALFLPQAPGDRQEAEKCEWKHISFDFFLPFFLWACFFFFACSFSITKNLKHNVQ